MTEPVPVAEATVSEAPAQPTPAAAIKVARKRRSFASWLPTRTQTLVLVIGLLTVSQAITFVQLQKAQKPAVITVGVREMSQRYLANLASKPNVSPQEAAIRTELFLAVSQDVLKRLAVKQGVVVLARECVLAGETSDLTGEVGKTVEAELDKASAGLAAAAKTAMIAPPSSSVPIANPAGGFGQ